MSRRRRKDRGFTLLELVVVLATIAVLASIAIPNLQHSFKRARTVEAITTVSAIERAMVEYYNRNNHYPPVDGVANPPFEHNEKVEMDENLEGWSAINFKPMGAYRYRYEFQTVGEAARPNRVIIHAFGDLDGDGQVMHITRTLLNGFFLEEIQVDD